MPRKPSNRTRLGQLRSIIGVEAKELAIEAGISLPLIWAIETERRRLTIPTAKKIAEVTGIDARWLLGAGLKTKPVARYTTNPFTRADYEQVKQDVTSQKNLKFPDGSNFYQRRATAEGELFKLSVENTMEFASHLGEEKFVLTAAADCVSKMLEIGTKLQSRMTREQRQKAAQSNLNRGGNGNFMMPVVTQTNPLHQPVSPAPGNAGK